jgi:hypothetical protein
MVSPCALLRCTSWYFTPRMGGDVIANHGPETMPHNDNAIVFVLVVQGFQHLSPRRANFLSPLDILRGRQELTRGITEYVLEKPEQWRKQKGPHRH